MADTGEGGGSEAGLEDLEGGHAGLRLDPEHGGFAVLLAVGRAGSNGMHADAIIAALKGNKETQLVLFGSSKNTNLLKFEV